MLINYLNNVMKIAVYEIREDDHSYWGEIYNLQGVWTNHETLEDCGS